MDEDLLKRNTDCVYFLASPLTCKKGVECEYRHHEIARLNPRDCWYWLSGNCLNPTCAFRHPPLDGHAGVPSEPIQSSVPASANKTVVPCYFFFNGFCNKGSRCSFSHKPDDSLLVVKPSKNDTVKPSKNETVKPLKNDTVKPLKIDTVKPLKNDTVKPLKNDTVKPLKNDTIKPLKNDTVKPLKNDNGNINALNLENKASSRNKTSVAPTPRETHFEQSLSAPKALSDTRLKSKENLQLPLQENVKQQSVCLEFSSFDYNEAAVAQSDSLVPDNGFAPNMSHSSSDQSSEEQENCHVEPEERWESSPGFDVLVHDESENLGYENGSEYLPLLDMDDRELNEQYTGYEFKNADEYDTICSEADIMYEQATCDDYICFDRDFATEREVCGYSREIALDSIFSRKRVRMSAAEMDACDSDLDLRDHLRRRREVNDPPVTGFVRRHDEPSSLMVRNQERCRRDDVVPRQNRRLTSQLGFSAIREVNDLSIANKHMLFRPSQQNRPRKHYREKPAKRPFPSSKVSRKPVVRQQRVIQESSTFSGPKTLAEIKEERRKKKAGESSHCESSSAGFEDPKPLHEILKDRRTMD